MRYFLFGLGAILFIALVFLGIPLFVDLMGCGTGLSKHDLITKEEKHSPNGIYVATTYTDMGGGAAGWCDTEVNVRHVGAQLTPNDDVFSSDCGTKVDLTWESDSALRVTFAPPDNRWTSLVQHAWTADRSVSIVYSEKEPIRTSSK